MKIALLLLLLSTPAVPNAPTRPREAKIEVFDQLGCTCSETVPGALECVKLPGFDDNDWTHRDAKKFAAKAGDFASRLETMGTELRGTYTFALQGRADSKEILQEDKRYWSEASDECRRAHDPHDVIENRDLAYLRACEMRRLLPAPLGRNIDLLKPVDYADPETHIRRGQSYKGPQYKTVILFIMIRDGHVCGNATKQNN